MCWMAPEILMSASVNVWPGAITTDGETFQPTPSSRPSLSPVPFVAMPPLPFSPVKFSGEIERVRAFESRGRSPRPDTTPDCATAKAAAAPRVRAQAARRAARESELMSFLLGRFRRESIPAALCALRREGAGRRGLTRRGEGFPAERPEEGEVGEPERRPHEREPREVGRRAEEPVARGRKPHDEEPAEERLDAVLEQVRH